MFVVVDLMNNLSSLENKMKIVWKINFKKVVIFFFNIGKVYDEYKYLSNLYILY